MTVLRVVRLGRRIAKRRLPAAVETVRDVAGEAL
jgi:hypothetical protein